MERAEHQHLIQPERRLTLPAYNVVDAARYAGVTAQTILNWQRVQAKGPVLGARDSGVSLSFLQLVELRFVAAMRESGVALKDIRWAREYLATQFKTEFPFADIRLKSDGQDILIDLEESEGREFKGKMLVANRGGQYLWKDVIGSKFTEFEYGDRIARRWHVAGKGSPVVIDPHVAFGAPNVRGVPTWVLKNRHEGGESSAEIARDFRIPQKLVKIALEFEKPVNKKKRHQKVWTTH